MGGNSRPVGPLTHIAVAGAWIVLWTITPAAEKRWVDVERSTVTIYLSAGDEGQAEASPYVLEAPLAEGSLDDHEEPHLALVINVDELRVLGPGQSAGDRQEARAKMLGPEGLDAERFTRVTYHSLAIEPEDGGVWLVKGELELHGRFLPLDLRTRRQGDRFTGSATVSPADFGVMPIQINGSSPPVGHSVRVDFDVVLEAR